MLLHRFLRALPVLVGAAAVAVTTWALVVQARDYKAPRGTPPANAFLWGGQWFNAQAEFAHWLHQRGAGYTRWANHHPQDLAALNGVFYPPRPAAHKQG
jgi:hypothetical protein